MNRAKIRIKKNSSGKDIWWAVHHPTFARTIVYGDEFIVEIKEDGVAEWRNYKREKTRISSQFYDVVESESKESKYGEIPVIENPYVTLPPVLTAALMLGTLAFGMGIGYKMKESDIKKEKDVVMEQIDAAAEQIREDLKTCRNFTITTPDTEKLPAVILAKSMDRLHALREEVIRERQKMHDSSCECHISKSLAKVR